MKMKNLNEDQKTPADLKKDANNYKKKLFYYQPKFKD